MTDEEQEGRVTKSFDDLFASRKLSMLGRIEHAYRNYVYWPIKRLWRRRKVEGRVWHAIERSNISWFDNPDNNLLRGTWYSFCDVLAYAIIPVLDRLIEHNTGYPEGLDPDEWIEILKEIRAGFDAHIWLEVDLSWTNGLDPSNQRMHWEALGRTRKQGLESFAKWYPYLWD